MAEFSLPSPISVTHKRLVKTNMNDPMTLVSNKQTLMLQTHFCVMGHYISVWGVLVLASVVGLFCVSASRGASDSQTAPSTGDNECIVYSGDLQYASMCHFCFLFRADLGGRDSLD